MLGAILVLLVCYVFNTRGMIDNSNKNSRNQRIKLLEEIYNNPARLNESDPYDEWEGRWFPGGEAITVRDADGDTDKVRNMFTFDPLCDDGKTNLTVDWDLSLENYTCFIPSWYYYPDYTVHPIRGSEPIPPFYHALHQCMDHKIEYNKNIVSFGTHRPAWAHYGEYKFIPRQRWLHNLEHGAVAMLYHPCAHPLMVSHLRYLVTHCLYRHIITPYNLLDEERPLALVTWGHYLLMNTVDSELVVKFIKETALKAPENINENGPYDLFLETPAKPVTNLYDTELCPNINKNRISDQRHNI